MSVEHKDGMYWCRDTYWPNGKLQSHEWGCKPPYQSSCCTVVKVKVGVKGVEQSSESDTVANGLLGYRTDEAGTPQSVMLIFMKDNIDDFGWVGSSTMTLQEDFPLINMNLIEGFPQDKTPFVTKGQYFLQSFEDFLYVEIPVNSLTFVADIPVE